MIGGTQVISAPAETQPLSTATHETDRARLTRLFMSLDQSSFTARHIKLYAIVIFAHLTDGLDLLMIGVVLPGITATFKLNPQQAGFFASSVFFGMMLGAIAITYIADRVGRKRTILFCVAAYTLASFATAFAWSYRSILVLHFLQGLALGAEVPLALTYILEFVPARRRATLASFALFPWQFAGLLAAVTAMVVIPAFGWRGMFVLTGVVGVIAFTLLMRIPESLRHLADRGDISGVERLVRLFSSVDPENIPSPEISDVEPLRMKLGDILRGGYLRFTLGAWIMSVTWGMAFFGMTVWLPSIMIRSGFTQWHSFGYTAAITGVGAIGVGLSGVVSDIIGRRAAIAASFFLGGASMIAWGHASTGPEVLVLGMLTALFGTGGVAGCLFTYISEIYPTHLRANASGFAGAWQRIGGMVAAPFLGYLIGAHGSMYESFVLLGIILFIGGLAALFLTVETREKSLEEITEGILER
jgi:MFS transporter, putative metabolite:H+ symporter